MQNIIAITNRTLAPENYWEQLENIAASSIRTVILREKTLTAEEYIKYAKRALTICNAHQTTCILHHFGKVAVKLHVPRFHCSLEYLEGHTSLRYYIMTLGVSVHTAEEAKKAEELGATYIMAGHVFETSCKPDLPPIGITVLKDICNAVSIPVYALGGINTQTVSKLADIPITGMALMSGLMTCTNIPDYLQKLSTVH